MHADHSAASVGNERRLFAVIPAAGLSRRMGRPKLLLSVAGQTVIRRLIDVLTNAGLSTIYILIRDDDDALQAEVSRTGATIVTTPVATRDMRNSVKLLLESIQTDHAPAADDGWLLCPADHPVLDAQIVQQLVQAWHGSHHGIVVPVHNGRRGHPTILAWRYAGLVGGIPDDRGINWLLETNRSDIRDVPVASPGILTDLDNPHDYDSLQSVKPPNATRICDPDTG